MYKMDELRNKKIVLYGTEKMQKDISYMFDQLDFAYYIDQKEDTWDYEAAIKEAVKNVGIESVFVIICTEKSSEIDARMVSCGLEYTKSFVYAQDMFLALDFDWRKLAKGRKIALWGTGVECDYFEANTSLDEKYLECYFDKNESKNGQLRNQRLIIHPSRVKDWKQYFIIVTTLKYYEDIYEYLSDIGLQEDIDFASYRKECGKIGGGFIDQPSEMMQKTFYAKPVNGPKCTQPFTEWNIQAGGNVCICGCPPWIHSKSIGTLAGNSCVDVQNSMQAKIFRLSIINRTYSFCDSTLCKFFDKTEELPTDYEIERFEDLEVKKVPDINVCFDSGCNLACRQCRKSFLLETETYNKAVIPTILRRLNADNWLNTAEVLNIAGSGEVFYNDSYKALVFTDQAVKRDSIILKSNGILFHEQNFEKITAAYKHINVSVSVDAASENTYRLLRGNTWNVLVKNLEMLSKKRGNGEIEYFEMTFCVQMDNVEEMGEFVTWAKRLHADRVVFQKMFRPEYMSQEEFQQYSCFDEDGILKEKAKKIFQSAFFEDDMVDTSQLH